MKKAFPGDPEFSWNRFYQLPYEYVLSGYEKMLSLRRTELHESELPTALSTAVYANSQRDPKSGKKPLGPMDFSFYKPLEADGPAGYYAACYVHLVKAQELPNWALFCYKEIAPSARGRVGAQYALFSHDAILVGPRKTESGYKGLLIAQESASGQVRSFSDPNGELFDLTLPPIPTKVVAWENTVLS